MSRPIAEPIPVKPSSDMYTGLLAAAFVAVLVGLIITIMRFKAVFNTFPWE